MANPTPHHMNAGGPHVSDGLPAPQWPKFLITEVDMRSVEAKWTKFLQDALPEADPLVAKMCANYAKALERQKLTGKALDDEIDETLRKVWRAAAEACVAIPLDMTKDSTEGRTP